MSYPTSTRRPRVTFTELETPFDAMPDGTTLDIACLDSTELNAVVTSLGYSKGGGSRLCSQSAITAGVTTYFGLNFLGNNGSTALNNASPFCAPLPTKITMSVVLDAAPTAGESVTVKLYDATASADVTGATVTIADTATNDAIASVAITTAANHVYCWKVVGSASCASAVAYIGALLA